MANRLPSILPILSSLCRVLPLGSALLLGGAGCIIMEAPEAAPPPPGDFTFSWSFAGETRCASAGVDEIGVQVLDPLGNTLYEDVLDCRGGGLVLTDFDAGSYELWLDAFNARGELLYQGEANVFVHPDMLNDIGVVELFRTYREGALGLYWGFLYPTDRSDVYRCDVAGAFEVDVALVSLEGQGGDYAATFACDDEGILLNHLPAGAYELSLRAYGRFQGRDLPLYEKRVEVVVEGDYTLELGDVMLERIYESFADVELTWGFAGGSCDQLGIRDVEFSLSRTSPFVEDDVFVVDCEESFVVRDTYVPGPYLIEARAFGSAGDFVGVVTLEIAPNTTEPIHVQLVTAE